jgi:hypothetical protein
LEWSPDEKYVAYIAEPPTTSSAFWDKDQKGMYAFKIMAYLLTLLLYRCVQIGMEPVVELMISNVAQGHKFDYREDWGEGFIGLSSPSIFLLEIDTENIISVKLEDKNLTVGQVSFALEAWFNVNNYIGDMVTRWKGIGVYWMAVKKSKIRPQILLQQRVG